MTASYQMPPSRMEQVTFRSKPVDPDKVHVVIPTYNDWEGLRKTLESLRRLKPRPLRITVVDDNCSKNPPDWLKEFRVQLAPAYDGNRGPAYARNIGFGFPAQDHYRNLLTPGFEGSRFDRKPRRDWRDDSRLVSNRSSPPEFSWQHDVDWFYFTDSGCEHVESLFEEFRLGWAETGDSCVAISGPVQGDGDGPINKFMTEQGILNPPKERLIYDQMVPQAIITANALISGIAFSFVGGFDETFPLAAGEDLDLGIRLRQLGMIGWAEKAVIRHRFAEDRNDFVNRFKRYGKGNRQLEVKHNLPSMRAKPYIAELPELQELADLQVKAMQAGYDEAVDLNARGKIVFPKDDVDARNMRGQR